MLIDSTPEGSKLTVWGWDSRPGEVHNEGTALIGPKVIVDQLYNYAEIDGQGSLVLPAGSDLSGADLKKTGQKQEQKSDPVVIHFREKMEFWGTKKLAVFTGKVNASQGGSWIVCSTMKVNLDRPVYFTQTNRPGASSKPANSPTPKQNGSPPAKGPNGQTAQGSTNPDEDKAKIEIVYCYPAPADAAESEVEKIVVYTQVERDPETGKPTRQQQLRVRELTLRAQVKDESRGEPYRMVLADGPGVCRIWAPESKDDEAGNGAPKQPGAAPQPTTESEMKLTEIRFLSRMTGKDKGDNYKEATFLDNIQVVNFPTENPDVLIELHRLPPEAVQLNCNKKLVVWSYKNPKFPEAPAIQHMHAFGNAFMRNNEYEGWGEEIRSEGKIVWFDGKGQVPARLKSRFKWNDNSGALIRFDRSVNRYTVYNGLGGVLVDGNGIYDENRPLAPPPPTANPNAKDPKSNNGNTNNGYQPIKNP
jgi:hypothetical protein